MLVSSQRKKKMVGFRKEDLDLILVPSGLIIMFSYHIFLLYKYIHRPRSTQMGYENNDKKAWVDSIMKDKEKNVLNALTVTGSNTNAAIYLATFSLSMCSLIGAWIANSSTILESPIIYGDTRPATISIKYISLLICFLLAFSCFVQSARSFVHTNFLISNPSTTEEFKDVVELAVIRGGECWSLGLRALYFALNLLLWFFGPIPMFVSSIVMVLILWYLDQNSTNWNEYGSEGSSGKSDAQKEFSLVSV